MEFERAKITNLNPQKLHQWIIMIFAWFHRKRNIFDCSKQIKHARKTKILSSKKIGMSVGDVFFFCNTLRMLVEFYFLSVIDYLINCGVLLKKSESNQILNFWICSSLCPLIFRTDCPDCDCVSAYEAWPGVKTLTVNGQPMQVQCYNNGDFWWTVSTAVFVIYM